MVILTGSTQLLAVGNPANGKTKAEACGGCHGSDGNSNAPIFPKLANQHANYIAKQLHDFKSQRRPEPTMSALAGPLTDQDIEDLSAYYAQQKINIEKGAPSQVGENLFRAGNVKSGVPACTGCHGPKGNGNPGALFPQLHGQYAAYLEKTLTDFKEGNRPNDLNGMMRLIAGRLSKDEIKAVSDYISTLENSQGKY